MKITQVPKIAHISGFPVYIPNEVRENCSDFCISYNSSSRDYGCPTTALVLNDPQMTKFYILRGDHRKGYEAAGNWDACMTYYIDHPDLQHKYSDKL